MARKNHERKAKEIEIWNILHARFGFAVQILESPANRTITPADELAAPSDRIAVTCIYILQYYEDSDSGAITL